MLAGLRTLFSTETFMARGHSYLWTPKLVLLEVATSAVIALAAAVMGVVLLRRAARAAAPARRAHLLLAAFAIALAAAHALDVWVIWTPIYGVDVIVRAATAVTAIGAAIALPRLLRRG